MPLFCYAENKKFWKKMDLNVFQRCWNFTTTDIKLQPRGESFDENATYTTFCLFQSKFQKSDKRSLFKILRFWIITNKFGRYYRWSIQRKRIHLRINIFKTSRVTLHMFFLFCLPYALITFWDINLNAFCNIESRTLTFQKISFFSFI